jgi:hypothetical protein
MLSGHSYKFTSPVVLAFATTVQCNSNHTVHDGACLRGILIMMRLYASI